MVAFRGGLQESGEEEKKESRGGDWERDRESLKGKFFWLSEDTKQE